MPARVEKLRAQPSRVVARGGAVGPAAVLRAGKPPFEDDEVVLLAGRGGDRDDVHIDEDGAFVDGVWHPLARHRARRPPGFGDRAAQLDGQSPPGHLQQVETGLSGGVLQEGLGVAAKLQDVERGVDDDARRREAPEDGRVGKVLQTDAVGTCQPRRLRGAGRKSGVGLSRGGRRIGDPRGDR